MIYTLIISLLIEKPFYLLSPQSFSFQIVSRVHRYFFEILQLYVPGMGLLTPCSVPRGGFLYTMIVPRGGFLLPSSRVPGVCPGGMVMDEIVIPALLKRKEILKIQQNCFCSVVYQMLILVLFLLGIPYRRGYLLYGPPGCGKSSFM